jgi:transcriptional regulator with XRE-family HTH domain
MREMRKILHELLDGDLTPGMALRGKRVSLSLSQAELAEITGVNRENISAIENDRIEMTVHYGLLFGVALGAHPSELLFPNKKIRKSEELMKIEKRAKEFLKKKSG